MADGALGFPVALVRERLALLETCPICGTGTGTHCDEDRGLDHATRATRYFWRNDQARWPPRYDLTGHYVGVGCHMDGVTLRADLVPGLLGVGSIAMMGSRSVVVTGVVGETVASERARVQSRTAAATATASEEVLPSDLELSLDAPSTRDNLVRWLGAHGHDCEWTRDVPPALAECVRRAAAGEEPLVGRLSPWCEVTESEGIGLLMGLEWRRSGLLGSACVMVQGWAVMEEAGERRPTVVASGPETGEEGRAACDEAAARLFHLDGDPEAPASFGCCRQAAPRCGSGSALGGGEQRHELSDLRAIRRASSNGGSDADPVRGDPVAPATVRRFALLLVPAPEHEERLLRSWPCGGRPPAAGFRPEFGGAGRRFTGREWFAAEKDGNMRAALVLWWAREPVLVSLDWLARVCPAVEALGRLGEGAGLGDVLRVAEASNLGRVLQLGSDLFEPPREGE